MTRIPLRPLARVMYARSTGENPDQVERAARQRRDRNSQKNLRKQAEARILLLGFAFFMAFVTVGGRMAILATSEPVEPKSAASHSTLITQRAEIHDRNGNVMATNLMTRALYARPLDMIEPERAATELAKIFPDLDEERLRTDFTNGKRKFMWLKSTMSPEERQAVHDIGEPGLQFGRREMRLYPNGPVAAHILGGTRYGDQAVTSAEILGVAGVEKTFDQMLTDPANGGAPLELSIDLSVQATLERVLEGGMKLMSAKGASATLMDVHTGEIIALASLPDFDPNRRPKPPVSGDPSLSPLFNRSAQGLYEYGSTLKIFTAGLALERGVAGADTMIETAGPWKVSGIDIKDFRDYGPQLSVEKIIVKSSNIGTGRLALMAGKPAQQKMLESLGLKDVSPIELPEAKQAKPLWPKNWKDLETVTISYGHGMSISQIHLAAAYAAIGNGGRMVTPTLERNSEHILTQRAVYSEGTARALMDMLNAVVNSPEGTASLAAVPGYRVAGKTGSAEKPKRTGGYYEDKLISSFASIFPHDDPKYVLVVSLDEPAIDALGEERRTAGWTAAPVASEIIIRVAPLLGLRPKTEEPSIADLILTAQ
ncbi:MAG: penicillin-binding protein 2 [Pseudomonadota bacterium]